MSNEMTVMMTKRIPPPTRVNRISRGRLHQRFDTAIRFGHRLILISAPAGYGKTTLVTDWLENTETPYNWLTLDENDNDPVRFLRTIMSGMQEGKTSFVPITDYASNITFGSLEPILTNLVNDHVSIKTPLLLILDDYHSIHTQAVHDSLEFLLKNAPATLTFVLITREDPPLSISRLRARAQLTEIRMNDLQFTIQEAGSFFAQTMGLSLDDETVCALQGRTEGWIAGLQLAGLSLQGRSKPAQFVSEFSGSHRYIFDYLVEQVLNQQPESINNFLLQISVLDRLAAPLVAAVAMESNDEIVGQAQLEWIEQAGLFLLPLDDERRWFRFHHLFQDVLRSRLIHNQPQIVDELHHRAMKWYEQNGFLTEAIQHAQQIRADKEAACLIEKAALFLLARYEALTVIRWISRLPQPVLCAHPRLIVFYSWALLDTGQLNEAAHWLGQIDGSDLESLDRGLFAGVKARLYWLRGEPVEAVNLADQVFAEDPFNLEGMTSLEPLQIFLALFAATPMAEGYRMRGEISAAIQTYQHMLGLIEPSLADSALLAAISNIEAKLGRLFYEQNDLELAEIHIHRSVELARKAGSLQLEANALLVLAPIKQAQGKPREAQDLIGKIEDLARERHWQPGLIYYSAARTRLNISQGNLDAVSSWVRDDLQRFQRTDHDQHLFGYVQAYADTTHLKALLALRKLLEAAQAAKDLLNQAKAAGQIGTVIEILAAQALVLIAKGSEHEALASLEYAVTLAAPAGYIRTFVDEGEPMRSLLYKLYMRLSPDTRKWIEEEQASLHAKAGDPFVLYLEKLLAAFLQSSNISTAKSPNRQSIPVEPALVEPISDREMQVLMLLNQGLSNQEIANQLIVSLGTVKRHTWNIYGKLGVNNRTQAILKARMLGFLAE